MERRITLSEKRRDKKKRILRNGESQRKDGRYAYKYMDNSGKSHFVYSWKLEKTDKLPNGKRDCESLREMERRIKKELEKGIDPSSNKITVLELVKKYVEQKTGVKYGTKQCHEAVVNRLKTDSFGQKMIAKVKPSDAKMWCIKLQQSGLCFGTVKVYKAAIQPAFQMAVDDDLILKNPFAFKISTVLANDNNKRTSLTPEQERDFLDFVREDKVYSKYYDSIFILFNTGLRISEFCGLTFADIDMINRTIDVNHQLVYRNGKSLYVESLKTASGARTIPMTEEVYQCFKRIYSNRPSPKTEKIIDGKTGFVRLTSTGTPSCSYYWDGYFQGICRKYNKKHMIQLPKVTPHICRHTYCSKMANAGMNPKTLQYLMGHSDAGLTLNMYTHTSFDNVSSEVKRIARVI